MTVLAQGRRAVVLAALSFFTLSACGGGDPSSGADRVRFAEPTASASGAASPSPSVSASPSPSPSPSPSASASASPEPSPSASASPEPSFPPQAPAVHGGTPTAVYLAVAYEHSDPELERARARARERGYEPGGGDVSCDQGAREALGLDPARDYATVALYFADRATAEQFVEAYEPGVVGYARVTTYCLD